MAKILILAPSGFGKSSSIVNSSLLGIKGLNPDNSFVISVTTKPLPGPGTKQMFPVYPDFTLNTQPPDLLKNYRRIVLNGGPTNNPKLVAHALKLLKTSTKIKNIVLDDFNYVMQDWYMNKAMSTGWDAPKTIGYLMSEIFQAIELLPESMNFIAMAHFEEYNLADGRLGMRMKTTGKMTQEYITPEGKFDIVLFGRSYFDESQKRAVKQFVTNDDGIYSSAKSPAGMFANLHIPNDLGYVIEKVHKYYDEGIIDTFEEVVPIETQEQTTETAA